MAQRYILNNIYPCLIDIHALNSFVKMIKKICNKGPTKNKL